MESKKRILFLIPEDEAFYLRYKFLYLVRELLTRYSVEVIVKEGSAVYEPLKQSWLRKFKDFSIFEAKELAKSIPISERSRFLALVKELIEDIRVNKANIELWKLLVLDDLAGSIVQNFHQLPKIGEDVKAAVVPLYHTNKAAGFGSYYQFQLYKTCKDKGIPVIGVELQRISDYYYYHYFFYDFYIVRSNYSASFLQEELGVPRDKVFILRKKYNSLLADTSLPPQGILKLFEDLEFFSEEVYSNTPIITIVHNLSERYATRRLIRALSKVNEITFNLIIATNPSNNVLFLKEREVVLEAYIDEILKGKFTQVLNLDTPRHLPEFFSLFSDIVIYTEPAELNNHMCVPENVVYYSPLNRKEDINSAFLDDEQLIGYVRDWLNADKERKTFVECVKNIVEDRSGAAE
jgi:hypothetical protein